MWGTSSVDGVMGPKDAFLAPNLEIASLNPQTPTLLIRIGM